MREPRSLIVYLSASMGVGQRLSLRSIDERVRRLPLAQTLVLLSEIGFKIERSLKGGLDVEQNVEIARHIFPASWMKRVEPVLRSRTMPCAAVSPQVVVLLGLRVLAYADEAAPREPNDKLGVRLGPLLLALGDHCDQGNLDEDTMALELVRLGLFYRNADHGPWMYVSWLLFLDALPQLTNHPEWMEPARRFERVNGIALERFWAMTYLQVLANSFDNRFLLPMSVEEYPSTELELVALSKLLVTTIPAAREAARRDLQQPLGWSMAALWRRPIVDLGEGRGPVLASTLMQMQCEPFQMFWRVRDALVAEGVGHEAWAHVYGAAVELLGIQLLRKYVTEAAVLSESEFAEAWSIPATAKRADAVVHNNDGVVAIDFVSRQFTRETTSTGDFEALRADLRRGVAEKIEQIDSTLWHALQAGLDAPTLVPLVVLGGPFPSSPFLDGPVRELLADLDLRVVGVDPRCAPWVAVDMASFVLMLCVCRRHGYSLSLVIDRWQRSVYGRHSFREWAWVEDLLGDDLIPQDWWQALMTILRRSAPPVPRSDVSDGQPEPGASNG